LLDGQFERLVDGAADLQVKRLGVQLRRKVVIADIKKIVGSDEVLEGGEREFEIVGIGFAWDQAEGITVLRRVIGEGKPGTGQQGHRRQGGTVEESAPVQRSQGIISL